MACASCRTRWGASAMSDGTVRRARITTPTLVDAVWNQLPRALRRVGASKIETEVGSVGFRCARKLSCAWLDPRKRGQIQQSAFALPCNDCSGKRSRLDGLTRLEEKETPTDLVAGQNQSLRALSGVGTSKIETEEGSAKFPGLCSSFIIHPSSCILHPSPFPSPCPGIRSPRPVPRAGRSPRPPRPTGRTGGWRAGARGGCRRPRCPCPR